MPPCFVYQTLPSGPPVIPMGPVFVVDVLMSLNPVPSVARFPMALGAVLWCVNQMRPSGPAVIQPGLLVVGIVNSVIVMLGPLMLLDGVVAAAPAAPVPAVPEPPTLVPAAPAPAALDPAAPDPLSPGGARRGARRRSHFLRHPRATTFHRRPCRSRRPSRSACPRASFDHRRKRSRRAPQQRARAPGRVSCVSGEQTRDAGADLSFGHAE